MAQKSKHEQMFQQLLNDIYNLESEQLHEVANSSDVTYATLRVWQDRPPTNPSINTFVTVAEAMGYELQMVRKGSGGGKKTASAGSSGKKSASKKGGRKAA